MWNEVRVQLHSFVGKYPIVSASFVEETTLSPLNGLGPLVKNQLAAHVIETLSCLGFGDLTLTLVSLSPLQAQHLPSHKGSVLCIFPLSCHACSLR